MYSIEKSAYNQTSSSTHTDSDLKKIKKKILHKLVYFVEILPLAPTAELCGCASLMDKNTTTGNGILKFGISSSMAINIFHQCLVRSWAFANTGRFLAGLFTFFKV